MYELKMDKWTANLKEAEENQTESNRTSIPLKRLHIELVPHMFTFTWAQVFCGNVTE